MPFHRSEYVAKRIFASFAFDLAGLRGLRLPAPGARFVLLLALFKVASFLDAPRRLRTACDLEQNPDVPARVRPSDFELPSAASLAEALPNAIGACATEGLFASPPVTEVEFGS